MAAETRPALVTSRRRAWLVGTVAGTLVPIAVLPLVAPSASASPARGLSFVLFIGSSVHVASTGWFYTVRELRPHLWAHRGRFYLAPVALILGAAAAASTLSARSLAWLVIPFFAWQFFHFQKQNLGLAALAARAHGVSGLSRPERGALIAAGIGGILGLIGHPNLLQVAHARRLGVLFGAGAVIFAFAVVAGVAIVLRRLQSQRPPAFVLVYLISLLFFIPVWLFASPYAAVAGLTIAHGAQYLLLVSLVATGTPGRRDRWIAIVVLLEVAVLLGLAVNRLSHFDSSAGATRALFGIFLGISAAHFVVDAGLWRLREEFPRAFLSNRLPYLLQPSNG